MKSLRAWVSRRLMRLPALKAFDVLIAYLYFFVAHRRIPKKNSDLFNDHLFHMKLSWKMYAPLTQFVSDKELVKLYYRSVIGWDCSPKTHAQFWQADELLNGEIPEECIIKPTHLSGVVFKEAGRDLDEESVKTIKSWFTKNLYRQHRERNYRFLVPSVICEEAIASPDVVKDYKILCYRGEPRLIQVDADRYGNHSRRWYTTDWEPLGIRYKMPLPLAPVEERPAALDRALRLAEKLAWRFELVRVDMYFIGEQVYLGEMTLIPDNAHGRFESRAEEREFTRLAVGA